MTYEDFVSRIEHADTFERLDALDALSMEADEHVLAQAASRLLADDDPGVREEAARLLAVSSEAAMGIAHISQTANKLRRETDALRQLVSQFKMANGGAESPPLPPREDRAPEPHAAAVPTPSDSIWT